MTQPVAQTRPSVACLDPADAESKFLTVDPGVQLHYWAAGDPAAPALVFVPGLTFSGEVFCQQLQHFKATHRVILVDPRGQGLSTKCDFGNDYQTHGADLVKLVAAEQLVRPTGGLELRGARWHQRPGWRGHRGHESPPPLRKSSQLDGGHAGGAEPDWHAHPAYAGG